jgi:hypothetical protein
MSKPVMNLRIDSMIAAAPERIERLGEHCHRTSDIKGDRWSQEEALSGLEVGQPDQMLSCRPELKRGS